MGGEQPKKKKDRLGLGSLSVLGLGIWVPKVWVFWVWVFLKSGFWVR